MSDSGDRTRIEERQVSRYRTAMAISVRERGAHQLPATLLELSEGGLRVGGVSLAKCGENPIWVRIPGLESLTAHVRWTGQAVSGLAFERPLHPAVAHRIASLESAPDNVIALRPGVTPASVRAHGNHPGSALASRRDQILAGYAPALPRLLMDKKPLHGSRSLIGLVRRTTDRMADHRSEARYPPPPEAAAGFAVNDRPARLEDISSSGLMAVAELDRSIGEAMDVSFEGFPPMSGTLIWKRDDRLGIAFEPGSIELAAMA